MSINRFHPQINKCSTFLSLFVPSHIVLPPSSPTFTKSLAMFPLMYKVSCRKEVWSDTVTVQGSKRRSAQGYCVSPRLTKILTTGILTFCSSLQINSDKPKIWTLKKTRETVRYFTQFVYNIIYIYYLSNNKIPQIDTQR